MRYPLVFISTIGLTVAAGVVLFVLASEGEVGNRIFVGWFTAFVAVAVSALVLLLLPGTSTPSSARPSLYALLSPATLPPSPDGPPAALLPPEGVSPVERLSYATPHESILLTKYQTNGLEIVDYAVVTGAGELPFSAVEREIDRLDLPHTRPDARPTTPTPLPLPSMNPPARAFRPEAVTTA